LSATGDLTLSGTVGRVVSSANNKRVLISGGSSAGTTTGAYAIFEGYDFGGAGAGGAIDIVSAAGTTNPITMSVGGTTRGVFSNTGLAITGMLNVGGSSRTTDKFTVKNTTTNEWAASVVSSGANASESLGLLIIAGTNNTDFALRINSQAGSALMNVSGSGIATMNAYGAGAATFSAAGVISSVSDETWKIKDGAPVDPDAMLNKLEPGYWYYNDEKKDTFGADRQLGFYAQNVNAAIGPEAAPEPEEGKPWGYYDRSVLAVTVMSLQKALATIEELSARVSALETK
jgi:hypothetical protein